jgi:glycosyltransferase involved in cell wall biosynthesis
LLKFIDTSFFYSNTTDLAAILQQHEPALEYANFLKKYASVEIIKHLDNERTEIINGVTYSSFRSKNIFWHIPFKTIRHIKKQSPDVVLVQGLIFPLQLIFLKWQLKKQIIILVQHHGEKPGKGIKKWLQQKADRFVNGYLFTSIENATPWIESGIIKNKSSCFELLEASTQFKKQDKSITQQQLQFSGNYNFLWVGRLNAGKDPLTVIKAFEIFCANEPEARLYMIYHTEELLSSIKKIIDTNILLQHKIVLVGKVSHTELERWYNAADFFISGSHFEGSGYALLEAMACGCIPVVTNIPSFNKITANGDFGFLYPAGDSVALVKTLNTLITIDRDKMSAAIANYFQLQLSFKSIADELFLICKKLTGK